MTVDEIIKETLLKYGYKVVHIGTPYEVINKQFVHKSEVEKLFEMIEQYGKEQYKKGAKAQHDADEELVDGCDNIYEALVKLSDNLLISEKQNDEQ